MRGFFCMNTYEMTVILSRCIKDTGKSVVVNGNLDRAPDISPAKIGGGVEELRTQWMIYDDWVIVRIEDLQTWRKFRIIYDERVSELVELMLVRRRNQWIRIG